MQDSECQHLRQISSSAEKHPAPVSIRLLYNSQTLVCCTYSITPELTHTEEQ